MTAAPCPGCEGERTQVFHVEGLDCASEVALIERELRATPGVCSVHASAATGRATVVHTLAPEALERAFVAAGFRAHEVRSRPAAAASLAPTALALGLSLAGLIAGLLRDGWQVPLYAVAIAVGGGPVARKGLSLLRRGVLDMNALMSVAVIGAMAIGEWSEGAATVVLFSLAQALESRSLERARRAIAGLMQLAPEQALVRRGNAEARVPASQVGVGETLIVGPGERFPLDGQVTSGESDVDQSPLTGESQRVPKAAGSEVFAGSINGTGVLAVRVTRPAAETTLARIIRRVEEAQASRAPSQGFVEAFARVYTPLVVALGVLVAVVPPLLAGGSRTEWLYRALVLLVIACPCALVISTPVSIVSALTAASRRGVLVKGGAHLEQMAQVRAVVFDKTGTLTRGMPEVTDVLASRDAAPHEVLRLAAAVEARSGHPVGAAVLARARQEAIAAEPAADVVVLPGRGARGTVDGRRLLVGSHRLFDEAGLCDHVLDAELLRLEGEGKTAVLVGHDGGAPDLAGVLAVADAVRPESAQVVAELQRAGLHVAMLTGDNARTAAAIARRLGIADSRAELLPEQKVTHLQAIARQHGAVAMVGDGVNDAPALAAASVGIAMGRGGTDAALETADIALMSDDLRRIPEVVALGRRTRGVIRQNIGVSLGVKLAVLVLALAGYGSLWAAVAADMGASLLVIGNGLRLLRAGGPEGQA